MSETPDLAHNDDSREYNHADIYTRSDGKFDFNIIAAENGNILCGSVQGYERRSQAVDIAKRILFGRGDPVLTFDGHTS